MFNCSKSLLLLSWLLKIIYKRENSLFSILHKVLTCLDLKKSKRDIRPNLLPPKLLPTWQGLRRIQERNARKLFSFCNITKTSYEQTESGCVSKQCHSCRARISSKVYYYFTSGAINVGRGDVTDEASILKAMRSVVMTILLIILYTELGG